MTLNVGKIVFWDTERSMLGGKFSSMENEWKYGCLYTEKERWTGLKCLRCEVECC